MVDPEHDDPVADLRRQRRLVAEHLAWLDQQITEAEARARTPATPSSSSVPAPAATPHPLSLAPADAVSKAASVTAERAVAEYQASTADVARGVRKGCLLYFVAALLLLGLATAVMYLLLRH